MTSLLLLTLYLVRIHAAYLIVNLLLVLCGRRFLQVLGEITQCRLVYTRSDIRDAIRGVRWRIVEQLAPNLLFLLRELQENRPFSFLLGNFDACDFVRQAGELENSLLARDWSDGKRNIDLARFCFECIISHVIQTIKLEVNAYRVLPFWPAVFGDSFAFDVLVCVSTWSVIPLMLGCLGLGGSRRNLSLYRNRLISNFRSALNLRPLDVLVPRVGISLMALCRWHLSGLVSTTSSMWRKRIESSSDTGKKLTSVSFPSNNGGLPRPLRSLSSSASSRVVVIVSDFGFLVGAVGISILLSPPAKADTVFTSVGLWRFWILLPSPGFL